MDNRQYLFIVGCPRSGTTALATLLAEHPSVVMGIERYGLRAFPAHFSLTPDLFERDRFLHFREGDTFYSSFDFAPRAYRDVETKFASARWVGDKIPGMYATLPDLFEAFGERTTVLFIFRNIFDVAASYKARLLDPNDNWSKGVSTAVTDWTRAIGAYRRSAHQERIIPIIYESLVSDPHIAHALFDRLGLEITPETRAAMDHLAARSETLESGRKRNLTMVEVMEICLKAPFGGFREIVDTASRYFGASPDGDPDR